MKFSKFSKLISVARKGNLVGSRGSGDWTGEEHSGGLTRSTGSNSRESRSSSRELKRALLILH